MSELVAGWPWLQATELVAGWPWLQATHWTWLVAGLVLLAFELAVPVTFFLWLGVSSLLTAGFAYLLPTVGWQGQFLVFSVLSVISIYTSRRYLVKRRPATETPNLNRRAAQYIGRSFTLTEPIRNGYGKVSVDDSRWQVVGPDMDAGETVKVIGTDGSVFTVEAASGCE